MSDPTQALQRTTYGTVFGRVLLEKRRTAGKEQEDVAEAVGVSQSTYSRIERGDVSVTLDMLSRLAAFYGAAPSTLVGDADQAANALRNMGVEVLSDRSTRDGEMMLALLGGAALAALITAALAKK